MEQENKGFEKWKKNLAPKDADWISINLITGEAELTIDSLLRKAYEGGQQEIIEMLKVEQRIHRNTDSGEVNIFLLAFLHRINAVVSSEMS